MNRLLWGILLAAVTVGSGWAQSTWRGQAEVWPAASAPTEGFVAASNEFPRNSLLTVENYRAKKTVQVRVVATLPAGSSALVLLNAKAAAALEIKAGDAPLVGVRIDPTGVERADNPDPDVNPLAAQAAVAVAPTPPAPVEKAPEPEAPASPEPVRTAPTSLEVVKSAAVPDPALIPLPALAEPEPAPVPVAEPTALAVAEEPEEPAPVTPGKQVFVATRDPEPVASEPPVEVVEPAAVAESLPATPVEAPVEAPVEEPVVEVAAEVPAAGPSAEALVSEAPAPVTPEQAPAAPEPTVVAAAPEPAPAAAAVPVPTAEVPPPVAFEAPAPGPTAVASAPVAVGPLPAPVPRPDLWVSVPGKLEGPVLGPVTVLAALDRGRSYVQVGAYASEAALLNALAAVKSYVPLSVYQAVGEKNPWRVLVAGAPKAQLGLLLMHFRSQGFRTAAVVKG